MGRPRTATSILEAKGAFRKDPQRKREDPEVTDPFPDIAPANLNPLQVKWWHRIVKMAPDAVLTGADQVIVRICAVLAAEFASDPAKMPTARIAQLRSVMGELGLSPAARAKLATAPRDDDGEF